MQKQKTELNAYRPAWWCRGGHVQTIAGALFRRTPKLQLTRERIDTPDGDFLDIDFLWNAAASNRTVPMVIIMHGLGGSAKAPYVQSLLAEIQQRGWNAAAVNMRMCSGETNRLKETYHSGKSEDLDCVIRYLRECHHQTKLYLTGFSIGGNIALKWLGENAEKARYYVKKAVAVSVPYDLMKSVELLDRGFNKAVYTRSLLNDLKARMLTKRFLYPDVIPYEKLKHCSTFAVFDREVTAPLNGFKSEQAYWKESSCSNFLKDIRVSTLLIHGKDDPFFPKELFPFNEVRHSPYLNVLMVPCAGHLGFISAQWPWQRNDWLERTILTYFARE